MGLYDPFGLSKKMTPEVKAKRLNIEVNNGRLAMIGIFGFMAADAVPNSVPLLKDIAQAYDGNIMAPFAADLLSQLSLHRHRNCCFQKLPCSMVETSYWFLKPMTHRLLMLESFNYVI